MKAPSTNLTFSYNGDHRYLGNAWQAAKNWTDLNTGITIRSGGSDTYIRFEDMYSTAKGYRWYARAEIPTDWLSLDGKNYLDEPPESPHEPAYITIYVNQAYMDKLDDFHRTLVLAHEIGHTLGLAHTDACGVTDKSLERSGGDDVPKRKFNTPQRYDRIALEQLYNF